MNVTRISGILHSPQNFWWVCLYVVLFVQGIDGALLRTSQTIGRGQLRNDGTNISAGLNLSYSGGEWVLVHLECQGERTPIEEFRTTWEGCPGISPAALRALKTT